MKNDIAMEQSMPKEDAKRCKSGDSKIIIDKRIDLQSPLPEINNIVVKIALMKWICHCLCSS